jgi:hypothetical protein
MHDSTRVPDYVRWPANNNLQVIDCGRDSGGNVEILGDSEGQPTISFRNRGASSQRAILSAFGEGVHGTPYVTRTIAYRASLESFLLQYVYGYDNILQ